MIKKAFVNGEEIPREAVQHEFERLARLYSETGMPAEEIKRNVERLLEQAQEQAIGAKLLLLRARDLNLTPDELVAEMEAFYRANKASFGNAAFVQVQTKIREFLRHAARSKVLAAFIADLREKAKVEYRDS